MSSPHKSVRRTRSATIASAGILLWGIGVSDTRASEPERISNTTPYRVSKPSAAKGRAGSAALSARALRRKSGETDVELTTGDFDAPNSPATGNISRVQVATTDARGRRQMVKEYADLAINGGYLAFTYAGLARGQGLSIDANVTGIDGARTDIVSAAPTVKLRPDLLVQRVAAPPKAVPGIPIVITGVIAELNQDVGARAACVLSVNGVEVDRADGIWVDAGGSVSCAFTHTFDIPGTVSVSVQAANVVPQEYDSDNNAAAATIIVREPELFDWYFIVGADERTRRGSHYQDWSTRADGSVVYGRDYEHNYLTTEWNQFIQYDAELRHRLDLSATRLSVTESTDGVLVRSFGLDQIASEPDGCVNGYAGTERTVWIYVCGQMRIDGPLTVLMYVSLAGEVTYFSEGYDAQWHRSADGTVTTDSSYSWNYAGGSHTVAPAPWGSTYSVDLVLTSPDAIYHGPLTMAVQVYSTSNNIPWQCWESSGDWGWERTCADLTDSHVIKSGFTGNR